MASGAFSTLDLPAGPGLVRVVEIGDPRGEPLVFLHGWPESWRGWASVMELAAADGYRAIAVDLPGIGGSVTATTDGTKRAVASVIRDVIEGLNLEQPTLIGQDVGGMVAYAYLHTHHRELARAVIANVVIPGLGPWEQVLANPYVWHFAFHAIPELPERLVHGREDAYFDWFWNAISASPEAITPHLREAHVAAYVAPAALTAGFDWYRAFSQDARDNDPSQPHDPIRTPLLYLRGEHEGGDMDEYVAGFHEAGVERVEDARIPGAGHYATEEAPQATWNLIHDFARRT